MQIDALALLDAYEEYGAERASKSEEACIIDHYRAGITALEAELGLIINHYRASITAREAELEQERGKRCATCDSYGEACRELETGGIAKWETCRNKDSPAYLTRSGLACLNFGCSLHRYHEPKEAKDV